MPQGSKAKKHHLTADYQQWGLVGSTSQHNLQLNDQLVVKATDKLINLPLRLNQLELVRANQVEYYQGEQLPTATVCWLRFERQDGINRGLLGEHLSVIYDPQQDKLLGITRMQAELAGANVISHQQALSIAIDFLTSQATDLVNNEVNDVSLNQLKPDERMIFEQPIMLGELQINWIDQHIETINVAGKPVDVIGMKVKMYQPKADLWTWVIVDKYGQVATFERNVSWDFNKMQRKTQMWLHDHWLQRQAIICSDD